MSLLGTLRARLAGRQVRRRTANPFEPWQRFCQAAGAGWDAHTLALRTVGEVAVRIEATPQLISEPAWRAEMGACLDALCRAGHAFVNLPRAPKTGTPAAIAAATRMRARFSQIGRDTLALVADARTGLGHVDAGALQRSTARLDGIVRGFEGINQDTQIIEDQLALGLRSA